MVVRKYQEKKRERRKIDEHERNLKGRGRILSCADVPEVTCQKALGTGLGASEEQEIIGTAW
jgi:hypothetical protein